MHTEVRGPRKVPRTDLAASDPKAGVTRGAAADGEDPRELARRRPGAVLCSHDVALLVALAAGARVLRVLGAASRAADGAARAFWPLVLDAAPRCVYIAGGHARADARLSSVERLRLPGTSWEALPPMAQPRGGAAVGVLAGEIYVCGGSNLIYNNLFVT